MGRIIQELEHALPGLSKAVFSQSIDKLSDEKVVIRPVSTKTGIAYQAESFRNNKAFHRNLTADALLRYAEEELEGRYRQVLIVSQSGGGQFCLKVNGEYKRTGKAAALPLPGGAAAHDREKEYLLREGENIPAFVDLGVFTQDFKIVRAKYSKYRQINRFVELVDQSFAADGREEISILDFGCGKSYLTFILYYYFSVKKGVRTRIIGYDLKADVVERCNEIAARYGYDGLRFEVADVTRDTLADTHIDMVVTLHACDTATDYALAYAVNRRVGRIFSVPCCQHEVNSSIHSGGELDLLLEYGIVKERVCALLTDSIRAAVLEDAGYKVDMIEFIDFEHSPKNIMLRAEYTGKHSGSGRAKAEALREKYGFTQTLLDLVK